MCGIALNAPRSDLLLIESNVVFGSRRVSADRFALVDLRHRHVVVEFYFFFVPVQVIEQLVLYLPELCVLVSANLLPLLNLELQVIDGLFCLEYQLFQLVALEAFWLFFLKLLLLPVGRRHRLFKILNLVLDLFTVFRSNCLRSVLKRSLINIFLFVSPSGFHVANRLNFDINNRA